MLIDLFLKLKSQNYMQVELQQLPRPFMFNRLAVMAWGKYHKKLRDFRMRSFWSSTGIQIFDMA